MPVIRQEYNLCMRTDGRACSLGAFSNPRSADAARVLRELFGEITDAVDARFS